MWRDKNLYIGFWYMYKAHLFFLAKERKAIFSNVGNKNMEVTELVQW